MITWRCSLGALQQSSSDTGEAGLQQGSGAFALYGVCAMNHQAAFVAKETVVHTDARPGQGHANMYRQSTREARGQNAWPSLPPRPLLPCKQIGYRRTDAVQSCSCTSTKYTPNPHSTSQRFHITKQAQARKMPVHTDRGLSLHTWLRPKRKMKSHHLS